MYNYYINNTNSDNSKYISIQYTLLLLLLLNKIFLHKKLYMEFHLF